jgi:lipopolysaccharide export system protein LptA
MIGRLALSIAMLFALALPAGAAAEKDPVNITADKFVVDDTAQVATFTGQVVVKRKKLTVWAPKVVVEYGEDGPSSIKSFVASGGVRIKTEDQDATGDTAVYDPTAETLRITGNVMVINASSTVGSGDLVIDLNANTTVFTGSGNNGRVTGIFTPQ